jgi:hypothetical protein
MSRAVSSATSSRLHRYSKGIVRISLDMEKIYSAAYQVIHIRSAGNRAMPQAFPQLFRLKRSSIDFNHHIKPTYLKNNRIELIIDELDKPNQFCNGYFESLKAASYHLVDKYMRQPLALSPGVRISQKLISRVWTLRKVKSIKSVSSMRFTP